MTIQSDRQNEDGLLPCPCPICRSTDVQTFERQEGLFVVSCENDNCIFTVEAVGGSRKEAVKRWNTRATPPVRDAAEGVVLRHHANETLEEQEYLLRQSAPPKPAPDALRAALPRYVSAKARDIAGEAISDMAGEQHDGGVYALACWFDAILSLDVLPVPDRKEIARGIVTEWLGMFDPPPQIDFQQSEFLQGAIASALAIPRTALHVQPDAGEREHHKLDNDRQVFFYEQDFYVLSNFSAFTLLWRGLRFQTSEQAYHWEKFLSEQPVLEFHRATIHSATSAHEAFKYAEQNKQHRRPDWDSVKIGIMRDILRAKAEQHEYVRRKLLATGDRELIEDSWRDDFWGWGPKRDGRNVLGKLWMEVRDELLSRQAPHSGNGED